MNNVSTLVIHDILYLNQKVFEQFLSGARKHARNIFTCPNLFFIHCEFFKKN